MSIRVAINGFGRIGRLVFKTAQYDEDIEFVAINDLTDAHTLAHLLKYDSVHGRYPEKVAFEGENLVAGNRKVKVIAERDPSKLPGNCGTCSNNSFCFGCRSSAHYYEGDILAADPKCYQYNPTPIEEDE